MIQPEQFARIAQSLSFLQRTEPAVVKDFLQHAILARIPAGADVFSGVFLFPVTPVLHSTLEERRHAKTTCSAIRSKPDPRRND